MLSSVCLLALLSSVTAARAQTPDDEVDLVDGTVLHGHVTGQVPGSYVIIQTPDGRTQSLPWSEVKRVATAAPPAALPTPTLPPAATAASVTPPTTAPGVSETAPAVDDHAHAPLAVHFEAGVRLGYSFSGGDYYSGASIGSASTSAAVPGLKGNVPFLVDAGVRIGPYVFVGAFFQYALLDTSCFPGSGLTVTCNGHDMRGGVEALFHLLPHGKVDPWIGFGIGHEWLELDMSVGPSGASTQLTENYDGWNFADLMLGVDFRIGASGAIGPYFEVTSGNFESLSASSSATGATSSSTSVDINAQSSHQWFTLGVRGAYELL
jgi:hypothetical protein